MAMITDKLSNVESVQSKMLVDLNYKGIPKPWVKHKRESEGLYRLFEQAKLVNTTIITENMLDNLRNCGTMLCFDYDKLGNKNLRHANFCRHRLCPMCNWRRSLKMFAQIMRIAGKILADDPSTRFIFVTLTVKNVVGADLVDTLNNINAGFKYITSKNQTFAPAKQLKKSLLGYMKALEITYNSQTDTYHPHIHCVLSVKASYFDSRQYLTKFDWAVMWQKALKLDYVPSVDVRNIKRNDQIRAVAEVSKYPIKTANLLEINQVNAVQALIVLSEAIKHKRLITFGGNIAQAKKALRLDDIENGDLVEVMTDPVKTHEVIGQVWYKWQAKLGCYIC